VQRIFLTALALLSGIPATASVEASDGNPGARINVTTISGPVVYGTAIKNDFTTTAALEGTEFTLSLDVLSGTGAFAQGQLILLLVEQADSIYGRVLATTGFPLSFDTRQFASTFDAAAFTRLLGAGASAPDFSGGTQTRFGFAAGNELSNTLTQYYDNFTLEIPEPGGFAMQVVALAALGSMAGRALNGA